MEYKINNFNLSDIDFPDLKSLSHYFEKAIPKQKINNILLGPNVLHLSNSSPSPTPLKKTPEDRKIISYLSRLIISSQSQKPEQSIMLTTNSFDCSKVFLKRIMKELSLILLGINNKEGNNDKAKIDQVKADVHHNISLVEFLTFFTCIKDINNDSIPITDYDLTFMNDSPTSSVKLSSINFRLMNYDLITCKADASIDEMSNQTSNVNFFYMLLYSLPIDDLFRYLYTESTREYFGIFDDEIELEDYVRRFVLINQFKLLKNEAQYEEYSKENENSYAKVKNEYEHYTGLYSRYLKVKAEMMLPEQFEQRMIGMFLGMILLAEFDIMEDPLYMNINKELVSSYSNSSIDLYTFIKNVVFADPRFQYIQTKEQNNCRIQSHHILAKIALNTTISEDRLMYLLITDLVKKGKGKVNQSKEIINYNCQQLISILYQSSMDKIKQLYDGILKPKKASLQVPKIQFIISKSNTVYEKSYNMYHLKDNKSLALENNESIVFDDNTYVISTNIREHIVNNYLQELKNYIYLNHSMTISCHSREQNLPRVDYNEEFATSLLNDNFNYDAFINLYENTQCGLVKLVTETSIEDALTANKEEAAMSTFKTTFDHFSKKKNIVQLIDLYNTDLQSYQSFILVKHSFGTFLYDLSTLFLSNQRPSIIKEQTALKYLDYKPLYNDNFFKYNQEMSFKLLKKLSMVHVFICNTIRLSKEYNTMTILDDFKMNNIYYFYYNFFNYVINVREVRESIIKSKAIQLTHTMIRDDLVLFKFLSKRLRISITDYYYSNGFIFARSKVSRAMDNNKNVAGLIFKYNPQLFYFLLVKKCTTANISYFHFIANCVKTFVKLTKIYNEKKVLSNVHNLLTDVIVDNYEIFDDENKKLQHNEEKPCNINHISKDFLPKIDKLNELVFDFKKEALSTVLPKLRANLSKLKRVWKDYISDIRYLEQNKTRFNNQKSTQLVIEQRLINFQILLFFFSKKYRFINSNALTKFGVLLTEFTKNVSNEVLVLLSELNKEFHIFLKDNDMNIIECNSEKLEGLIAKRIEIQKATRIQNRLKKAKIAAQKTNEYKTNDEPNINVNEFDSANDNSNRNDSNSESNNNSIQQHLQEKRVKKYTDKHSTQLIQTKMKMPPQMQLPPPEMIHDNELNIKNIPSFKDMKNPKSEDCRELQEALDRDLRSRSKRSSKNKVNKYLKNYGIDPDKVNQLPEKAPDNKNGKNDHMVVDFKEELMANNNSTSNKTEERKGRSGGQGNKPEEGSMMMTSNDSLSKVACGISNNNNENNNPNNSKDISSILNNMDINKTIASKLKALNQAQGKTASGNDDGVNNSSEEVKGMVNQKELSDRLTKLKLLTGSNANDGSSSQRNQTDGNKPSNSKKTNQSNKQMQDKDSKVLKGKNTKPNSQSNSRSNSKTHSKNNSNGNIKAMDQSGNIKQKAYSKGQSLNHSKGKISGEASKRSKEPEEDNSKSKSTIKSKEDSTRRYKSKSPNKDLNEQLEGKDNQKNDSKGKISRPKTPSSTQVQGQSRPLSVKSQKSKESHKNKENADKGQHKGDIGEGAGDNGEEEGEDGKNKQVFKLPALKELDDKIRQLKKELHALEIMGSLTEKTTVLCFRHDENNKDPVLLEESEKIDKEFYDDIEEKLKLADKAIQSQFA